MLGVSKPAKSTLLPIPKLRVGNHAGRRRGIKRIGRGAYDPDVSDDSKDCRLYRTRQVQTHCLLEVLVFKTPDNPAGSVRVLARPDPLARHIERPALVEGVDLDIPAQPAELRAEEEQLAGPKQRYWAPFGSWVALRPIAVQLVPPFVVRYISSGAHQSSVDANA